MASSFDSVVRGKKRILSEEEAAPYTPKEGFKFGADPELFIFDKDDRPVPACGLIPGTKQYPFPVDKGAIQVDGTAAEFNIDAANTFEEFSGNIDIVLEQLRSFLPPGHTLKAVPFVRWDQAVFDAMPDDAKELGCSPDFNAWTGEQNNPPDRPETDKTLAVAAGHIHIGWTDEASPTDLQHIMNCRDLVKQLDWYVGSWSVKHDTDPTRRSMYGRAGACRYKPYGVEYRVLGNFWVLDPKMRLLVWNRMQTAINNMRALPLPDRAGSYNDYMIQSINETRESSMLSQIQYPYSTLDQHLCCF